MCVWGGGVGGEEEEGMREGGGEEEKNRVNEKRLSLGRIQFCMWWRTPFHSGHGRLF